MANLHQAFACLEVPTSASWEEVRLARRDLTQIWHPDRFEQNPRLKDRAQSKLKEINIAFDLLKVHFETSPRPIESTKRPRSRTAPKQRKRKQPANCTPRRSTPNEEGSPGVLLFIFLSMATVVWWFWGPIRPHYNLLALWLQWLAWLSVVAGAFLCLGIHEKQPGIPLLCYPVLWPSISLLAAPFVALAVVALALWVTWMLLNSETSERSQARA